MSEKEIESEFCIECGKVITGMVNAYLTHNQNGLGFMHKLCYLVKHEGRKYKGREVLSREEKQYLLKHKNN